MSSRVSLGALAAGSNTKHDFRLEAPARVRGTVTGEQTGQPQTGARIAWTRDKESNTGAVQTGEDGGYALEFFVPGTYWIYSIPASGEWSEDNAQAYGRSVTLTLGAEQTVDFRLPDAFPMEVRMVDGQGKPVPNAPVQAYFCPDSNTVSAFAHGETDAAGRYRFKGFRAGFEGWLTARLPEQNPVSGGGTDGADRVTSTHVVGEPGADYPEETLVLYGSSGLCGVALGPNGKALANCSIQLQLESQGISIDNSRTGELATYREVQTDAAGSFALAEGVPATLLSMTALTQGEDGRVYRCDVGPMDCPAGQVVNLGRLTFQVDPDAKREVGTKAGWFVNINGE